MEWIDFSLWFLIALVALCLLRIILGPTVADRVVAIDIMGIIVVGICMLLAIRTGRSFLIDIGIAWIILSFIGTLTMAKYLERRKLNE
ncbi:MAG: monovalent cation/H+ antiporter complex subunit F [Bacteroidales bacterium]|nr:monovalent cation/H+ antiporter complex subunit F [Bacteroidales bacterium]